MNTPVLITHREISCINTLIFGTEGWRARLKWLHALGSKRYALAYLLCG
jgi:hypothetical protein